MRLRKNKIIGWLVCLFLLIHIYPLLSRTSYRTITLLNYSIVLPVIMLFSINLRSWRFPFKYVFLMGLVLSSFALYFLGASGSISALLLCASVPFFIFNNIHSSRQLVEIFYLPIKIVSIMLIIAGLYLFYNIRGELMEFYFLGEYFIIASINYVSLLFFCFSIAYFLLFHLNEKYYPSSRLSYLLGVVLITLSSFFSFMYLTRSTFIVSFLLLALYLRRHSSLLVLCLIPILFLYGDIVYKYAIAFWGSDKIITVAEDSRRIDSVLGLIQNAVSFNYNFRESMSFSSLINLLFSLFPFSLIFIIDIVRGIINAFAISLTYCLLIGITLLIVIYQMDFLSIFLLFFLIEVIFLEKREASLLSIKPLVKQNEFSIN